MIEILEKFVTPLLFSANWERQQKSLILNFDTFFHNWIQPGYMLEELLWIVKSWGTGRASRKTIKTDDEQQDRLDTEKDKDIQTIYVLQREIFMNFIKFLKWIQDKVL